MWLSVSTCENLPAEIKALRKIIFYHFFDCLWTLFVGIFLFFCLSTEIKFSANFWHREKDDSFDLINTAFL